MPSESLSHNKDRSLMRKVSRYNRLGIRLIIRISFRDFRNKFLCTTAMSKQYEDDVATTEQICKQLMPHQTSCLRRFLTYPTAPSKLPTLKQKSSGRVLTSADSIRALEEKKRKKEEKAIKKEENAKKRKGKRGHKRRKLSKVKEKRGHEPFRVKGNKAPNRLL